MEEILRDILAELRKVNDRKDDIEQRLSALENQDRLLTPTEAKDYLGVSYNTLRARCRRGYIQLVEQGGRHGYLLSQLNKIKEL